MKLVLYSGGNARENKKLVQETLSLLGKNPVIAFVPAESHDAVADFQAFKRKFAGTKVKRFHCVSIDGPLSTAAEEKLFSADAIYLGGGNTFYFLQQLRASRLLPRLREYVKKGGVLLGLSAGSILMTPTITTAAVPVIDSDDNDVGLKNLNALDLVPFEFSPHYYASRAVDAELLAYSRSVSHPIYAAADGHGIVVNNGKLQFVGPISVFHRGAKYRIQ